MLRFVASYFISDTKPNTYEENSKEPFFNVTTTKNIDFHEITSDEVEQLKDMDIQSLRKQKLQELAQKVILRKLARQAVMNKYSQDHVPLSQIQEKLEEDDVPLAVLQDRLKQDESPSYHDTITTIRENINFLLYGKPSTNSKKPRQNLSKIKINDNTINNNNVITPTPKDDRDYDVWDDAIIGRLMNLIDTVGVDLIQEETSEGNVNNTTPKVNDELVDKFVKEVMKEVFKDESPSSPNVNNKENSNFSLLKGSTEDTINKETIVTESSSAATVAIGKDTAKNIRNNAAKNIRNNNAKNIRNNTAKDIKNDAAKDIGNNAAKNIKNDVAKEIGNNAAKTIVSNVEEDVMENVENNTIDDIQEEETKLESIKIAEEIIDFGETINVAESLLRSDNSTTTGQSLTLSKSFKRESRFRRSIFPLGHPPPPPPPSSSNNKPKTLRRTISDLNRRGSIHSRKSYDNDISRRSSISSKISVNTTADVIIEENENDSDNIKFRKRFTSQKSNKSIQFFKGLWKNNQNLPLTNSNEEFISNKESMEMYHDNELHRNKAGHEEIADVNSNRSEPGYSNFYLSMPNGKWMVRTRTASRQITGTQYIDKEYI